jgi:hypothetical protein
MLQVPVFPCNACQFRQRRYSDFNGYCRRKLLEKLVTHKPHPPSLDTFSINLTITRSHGTSINSTLETAPLHQRARCVVPLKRKMVQSRAGLLFYGFVGGDFAVADVDDAVGVLGDIVFVGDEDDGVALAV